MIAAALIVSSAWTVSAAAAGRPNILVIVTDDQRVETLAAMPHAEGAPRRGLVLPQRLRPELALLPEPRLDPHRSPFAYDGVFDNVAPHGGFAAFDDRLSIATVLDDEGYRTAFLGRYLNGYVGATYDNWSYVPPVGIAGSRSRPARTRASAASDGSLVGPFGPAPATTRPV